MKPIEANSGCIWVAVSIFRPIDLFLEQVTEGRTEKSEDMAVLMADGAKDLGSFTQTVLVHWATHAPSIDRMTGHECLTHVLMCRGEGTTLQSPFKVSYFPSVAAGPVAGDGTCFLLFCA